MTIILLIVIFDYFFHRIRKIGFSLINFLGGLIMLVLNMIYSAVLWFFLFVGVRAQAMARLLFVAIPFVFSLFPFNIITIYPKNIALHD